MDTREPSSNELEGDIDLKPYLKKGVYFYTEIAAIASPVHLSAEQELEKMLALAGDGVRIRSDRYNSPAGVKLTIDSRVQRIAEQALAASSITRRKARRMWRSSSSEAQGLGRNMSATTLTERATLSL